MLKHNIQYVSACLNLIFLSNSDAVYYRKVPGTLQLLYMEGITNITFTLFTFMTI